MVFVVDGKVFQIPTEADFGIVIVRFDLVRLVDHDDGFLDQVLIATLIDLIVDRRDGIGDGYLSVVVPASGLLATFGDCLEGVFVNVAVFELDVVGG